MSKNIHSPAKQDHTKEDIFSWSREELHKKCLKQQEYIKELEQKYATDEQKQNQAKNVEPTRRENVLAMRLANKQQEVQEYVAQINHNKKVQEDAAMLSLRQTNLDPGINLLFGKMRDELQQTKSKLEEAQGELSAWKFTPDSQNGKKLISRCRTLVAENQELERQLSYGKSAQLKAELALQKKYNEEMKASQDELNEFVIQLDEEVETMQSRILDLQQQLAAAKQENEDYLKSIDSFEIIKTEPNEFDIKAEFDERESSVSDENASEHSSNEGFYSENLQETISPRNLETSDRTPTQNERDDRTEQSDTECANSLKSENIHSPKTPISENEDDIRTRGDYTTKFRTEDLNDVDIDFDISDTWDDRTSPRSVSDIDKNENDVDYVSSPSDEIKTRNKTNVAYDDVKSDQNAFYCDVKATVPKIQSENASDDVNAKASEIASDDGINMEAVGESQNILHHDIQNNLETTVPNDAAQDTVGDDDTVTATDREFKTENVQATSCDNVDIARTASDDESKTDHGIHLTVCNEEKIVSAVAANEPNLENPPREKEMTIRGVTEREVENASDGNHGIVETTEYKGDAINLHEPSIENAHDNSGDTAIVSASIDSTMPKNELDSQIVLNENVGSKTEIIKTYYDAINDNVIETDPVDPDACENDLGSRIALNQNHVNVEESNHYCQGDSASVNNETEMHVETELNNDIVDAPQSPIPETRNVTSDNASPSKTIVSQLDKSTPVADKITPRPGFQGRRDSDWSWDSDENDKDPQSPSSNHCPSPNKRTSSNWRDEVPVKKSCVTPDVNHAIDISSQNGFDESTPNTN